MLYDSDDGPLYFDSDGLGGKAPNIVAVLDNFAGDIPKLTAADLYIV